MKLIALLFAAFGTLFVSADTGFNFKILRGGDFDDSHCDLPIAGSSLTAAEYVIEALESAAHHTTGIAPFLARSDPGGRRKLRMDERSLDQCHCNCGNCCLTHHSFCVGTCCNCPCSRRRLSDEEKIQSVLSGDGRRLSGTGEEFTDGITANLHNEGLGRVKVAATMLLSQGNKCMGDPDLLEVDQVVYDASPEQLFTPMLGAATFDQGV